MCTEGSAEVIQCFFSCLCGGNFELHLRTYHNTKWAKNKAKSKSGYLKFEKNKTKSCCSLRWRKITDNNGSNVFKSILFVVLEQTKSSQERYWWVSFLYGKVVNHLMRVIFSLKYRLGVVGEFGLENRLHFYVTLTEEGACFYQLLISLWWYHYRRCSNISHMW